MPPTREENMSHGLSAISTRAHRIRDSRNIRAKEKVVESDLLGSELDEQSVLALGQSSWSLRTFLDGAGAYRKVAGPFVALVQLVLPCLSMASLHHIFSVDLRGYSSAGESALAPRVSSSRHPVASLAAMSAASLPSMPSCEGIHRTVTMCSLFCRVRRRSAICVRIYAPDLPSGRVSERLAAWLSVKMAICWHSVLDAVSLRAISMASRSFAAYTVDTLSVPMYAHLF